MRRILLSTHIGTMLHTLPPFGDEMFQLFDQVKIIAGRGEYRLFLTSSRPIRMQHFSGESMGVVEYTFYNEGALTLVD